MSKPAIAFVHPKTAELNATMKIKLNWDTWAKRGAVDSTQLPDDQKVLLSAGTELDIHWDQPEGNHVLVSVVQPIAGFHNWYFYNQEDAVEIIGKEPDNNPTDVPPEATPKGKALEFPGFQGVYYIHHPIIANGNFTWGEATHGGDRIPVNADVVNGMIRIAKVMQDVRALLGDRPITVNSWYRDPVTNQRVGGASRSRHLSGDAVDFVVRGIHPSDVYKRLNPWWGNRGGLASSNTFTHIDARGYRARWSY
ncbi:MAG: D-Ala-D-Ala carboxypeptidase family metallohydrolase [Cyanobacteria bacterium P01_A01_bin.123]